MSLKYFHIFFIVVSILFCLFFGFWSMENYYIGETEYLYYAIVSFVAAAALVFYGRSVFKKLKSVGFFVLAMSLLLSPDLWACSTCYGDPNSPVSKALTASVLCLLVVITFVLSGFVALMIHYNKRSKSIQS